MQTVLLDFSRAWGNSQAHLLALALALHAEDRYKVHICCPRNSPLARKAREHSLPLLALWGDSASNPLTLLRLWLLARPSLRCLIHTFSPAAAVAGARLLRLRQPHSTLLLHNVSCKSVPLKVGKGQEPLPAYWHVAHKILCANQHERSLLLEAGLTENQLVCLPAGVDTQALSAIRQQDAPIAPVVPAAPVAPVTPVTPVTPVAPVTPVTYDADSDAQNDTHSAPKNGAESAPGNNAALPSRYIVASLTGHSACKAHSVLLKAMAALWQREDLPPWEIRIIGACSNFQALLDEATSLGVQSRLALLDDQPLTETLPLCHAVVAPSLSPQGSLPVMAAAWALGLPLLCPALSTNQEWARHEENALLYSAEDPQQLATCLKKLMHTPQLCHTLSEGGLRSAPATSIATAVEHCRSLYADLLHTKGWVLPQPSPRAELPADKAAGDAPSDSKNPPTSVNSGSINEM